MNLQFYIEKLENAPQFKKFLEENPNTFACSGFFVIDKQGSDNKQHIDYFVPEENKIYSFQLENDLQKVPLESIGETTPEQVSFDYDFDFSELEDLISKEMQSRGIKNKVQKLIFSLQNVNGETFLIGTIFVSGLGLIKLNIDIKEKKITDFEKKSFFSMMNMFKGKKSD